TYVVVDGLHPFAAFRPGALEELRRRCRGIVYRAHNFETTLWEQCAKKARTPWFRWLYRHQADRVRQFEQQVAQTVSWVTPVSVEDARRFKVLAADCTPFIVPIGIDFPSETAIQPVDLQSRMMEVLFVGRLDWLPNKK